MHADFWLNKWEQGQTGFHQERVHPALTAFAARFLGDGPHRVLVPLAGKTWDLDHLAKAGHSTVAVELSAVAAAAFHTDHGRDVAPAQEGPYSVYRSENLEYRVGDVFDLDPSDPVDRIWDRAALVALNPEQRVRYAALLTACTRPGARMLLSVFDYPQDEMPGPPHSVPNAEVDALYGQGWRIELLKEEQLIDQLEKFRARGVTSLVQSMLLLTRR